MRALFAGWLPSPTTANRREQLRAACGALLGIMLTAMLSKVLLEPTHAAAFLVALAAGVVVTGFLVVGFKRFIAPKELAQAESNPQVAAVPA